MDGACNAVALWFPGVQGVREECTVDEERMVHVMKRTRGYQGWMERSRMQSGAAGVWALHCWWGSRTLAPRTRLQSCAAECLSVPNALRASHLACSGVRFHSGGLSVGVPFNRRARAASLGAGCDLLRSATGVGAGAQPRRADTSVSVSDGLADGEAQLDEVLRSGEFVRRSLFLLFFF
ncbi:hypothetical protein NDU88_001159 [Pleurodeles waltl]|uniref:Uncharacterized protein n=1 Tax=Pleurodeles waltl TaxID=8319 RepID=A0AAV7P747_PLEWA|nr:hypothetical protein NDU88_001159 [Pleurodeles waltl]